MQLALGIGLVVFFALMVGKTLFLAMLSFSLRSLHCFFVSLAMTAPAGMI